MKKKLGFILCCALAGCANVKKKNKIELTDYAYVDTAPLDHIHIQPSRRAIEYKYINFPKLARKIRKILADEPINTCDLRLILVDYGELPAMEADDVFMKTPCGMQTYYSNYNAKLDRYFFNIKFYNCNQKITDEPVRDITVTLAKEKAPPYEAIKAMSYEAVLDFHNYRDGKAAKKIVVDYSY